MEGVGDRARAVVAGVVPAPVAAAVLVRLGRRSGWRRGRRAAITPLPPPPPPRAAALEDRSCGRSGRARPRWRGRRSRRRSARAGAGTTSRPPRCRGRRCRRRRCRARAGARRPRRDGCHRRRRSTPCGRARSASALHVAGPTIPSAVEAVAALEALDRALGAGAEDAVGVDAEPVLDLHDPRPVRAALEHCFGWRGGREHGDGRQAGDDASRGRARVVNPSRSVRPSAFSGRLRGELTGSRSVRYAVLTTAIRPRDRNGRCGSPVRRPPGDGDSAAVVVSVRTPPACTIPCKQEVLDG